MFVGVNTLWPSNKKGIYNSLQKRSTIITNTRYILYYMYICVAYFLVSYVFAGKLSLSFNFKAPKGQMAPTTLTLSIALICYSSLSTCSKCRLLQTNTLKCAWVWACYILHIKASQCIWPLTWIAVAFAFTSCNKQWNEWATKQQAQHSLTHGLALDLHKPTNPLGT